MEFYLREANACHDVLDAFGVTRVCDEQTLSVSQRMKALHDMMIKFNVSVVSFREYAESWNASRRGGG